MYNQFFGFKERPFKLVPDPDYLFLSKSHEEALAHLRYAVTDGEGFVEIIGEIGTGKTMLCRTFLEGLNEDTESAYIFNPRMDAVDLLKAINDEFDIPSHHHSVKALIDALNNFLIKKKAADKKVILLIDEAQNLSKEVLEQIRLLSNLETTKDKLLQIILVGQPELGEMLDAYELRQLGQRISLSCRLHPLTYFETKEYIAHRIHVASSTPASFFSKSAIQRIYKFSRGIPRLINMACDRSLLTAYGRHRLKVSASIANSAIRELTFREGINPSGIPVRRISMAVFSVLGFLFIAGLLYFQDFRMIINSLPMSKTASSTAKQIILPELSGQEQPKQAFAYPETRTILNSSGHAEPLKEQNQVRKLISETSKAGHATDFQQWLIDGGKQFSKTASFEILLKKWGVHEPLLNKINEIPDDPAFFSIAARQNGFVVTPITEDLKRVVQLNIPAILKFNHLPDGNPVYLTVIKVTPDAMIFSGAETLPPVLVPYAEIMENWSGKGFVFWKNFYNYQGIIPLDAPGESIITLKLHLRDIGYQHIEISGTYDLATRMAIKAIQARHGIPIDGYVGPLTKIVLYNEKPSLAIPHLWEPMKISNNVTGMETTSRGSAKGLLEQPSPDN